MLGSLGGICVRLVIMPNMGMLRFYASAGCALWLGVAGCGPAGPIATPGLVNTHAGVDAVQTSGQFLGTGTLTSSQCDAACAPTHNELLRLSGTPEQLKVKVGATLYPARVDGATVSWTVFLALGPCGGSGLQIGAITLTDAGGQGTRVNASVTHCNHETQHCSCTYQMAYTRQTP